MATEERFDEQLGLSSAEVAKRTAAGDVNVVQQTTSRTRSQIVRANLFTRFNALVVVLASVILVFGDLIDLTFALVMVLNAVIGIVQELRAKATLDALSVMLTSSVVVIRDGVSQPVHVNDIVLGECVCLTIGDQVPVDATVIVSDGLEVDESSLTGEADPVAKVADDEVRSGSAVVSGSAQVVATRVGANAWVRQLEQQAKTFDPVHSELRGGIDQLLRIISWMLVPLGALLVWSQLRAGSTLADGLVSAVAGVIALVPQGLVLLVSMTMATAVVRLARDQVVVRELPAVEGLARVDVICLDKTGTLTTGKLALEAIEPIGAADPSPGLAALANHQPTRTAMWDLIAAAAGAAPEWPVIATMNFSSARKWSGMTFAEQGTWVVGAPEMLIGSLSDDDAVGARIRELTATARRVLLVATSASPLDDSGVVPADLVPNGLIVMREEVRGDAAATMRYFLDQGVTVKIISGDSADTVAAVATQLGIPGAEAAVDLRDFTGDLATIVDSTTVFGRVLPEQKRELVLALQHAGHTVAMTGDGVNDIPALKASDIGIAMDTATPATKAVAQLVLLNGRFDLLPGVVGEGRRVIANMERVSSLFVTKTVYATMFALAAGIFRHAYPFLPRHLALVADLTVGVPAFFLGFRPSLAPCRPGYLQRVLRFSLRAGPAVGLVTLGAFALLRSDIVNAPLPQARTGTTITLAICGFWILYQLVKPLKALEAAMIAALIAIFAAVVAIPRLARLYALHLPSPKGLTLMLLLVAATLGVLEIVLRRLPGGSKT